MNYIATRAARRVCSRPRFRRVVGIAGLLTLLFVLIAGLRPVVVIGESMQPSLRQGRLIWIRLTREETPFSRGDIVIVRQGKLFLVKRIYGLPGQQLWFLKDVDQSLRPVRAAHVERLRPLLLPTQGLRAVTVPDDHVYVLGDNLNHSEDSRAFGAVPVEDIVGRALLPTSPLQAISNDIRYTPAIVRRAEARGL